jgi:hypothetical protein
MARFGSKAFKRGLLDGFASAYSFLAPAPYSRPARNLVEQSWQAVGNSIVFVMSKELTANGKAAPSEPGRKSPAATPRP